MSHSRKTQQSAYKVYSSETSKSSHHSSRSYRKHSHSKEYNSDDSSTSSDHSTDEQRHKNRSSKTKSSVRSLMESPSDPSLFKDFSSHKVKKLMDSDDKFSVQPLMDIDFGKKSRSNASNWKDMSSNRESYSHSVGKSEWKDGSRKNANPQPPPPGVDITDTSNYKSDKKIFGDGNSNRRPLLETPALLPPRRPANSFSMPDNYKSESRHQKKSGHSHESEYSTGNRKSDRSSKSSVFTEKRSMSDDTSEVPTKRSKPSKSKAEANASLLDSNRINSCRSKGHTFIIIPSTLTSLHLHGRCQVTVLLGSVNILGWNLKPGSTYHVYSPACGSLLALYADGTRWKLADLKEEMSKFSIPENDSIFENVGNNTVAVLMLDRLESVVCDYVTSFIPYTQLFSPAPSVTEPRGVLLSKLGLKLAPMKEMGPVCMSLSPDYQDLLAKWTLMLASQEHGSRPPVVLCCGAKNTGKSTLNRMMVNAALSSVSAVAYLECDVGQTEFSPPATLSLHVLDRPILEPPFCHQRQAERMVFYGDTTPSSDPSFYTKCLKFVVDAYLQQFASLPLVINTMGFPEGIGIMLLVDVIRMLCPNLVVQINTFNQAANMPPISSDFLASEDGWTYSRSLPVKDDNQDGEATPKHELIILQTLVSQRRDFSFKLKPVDLRNLTLLSSLAMNLEKGMTLASSPPFVVPYRQFGVHICHHRLTGEEILTALDASVVALCVADLSQAERKREELPLVFPDMPVCTCLGLGIIRAVDIKNGLLYLVTTLPRVQLQKMNTILKGSLSVPDQMFLKQTSSEQIPYVDALAPSTAVASVRPRSRMPRISLGGDRYKDAA